jgi:hypothetical protein
VLAVDTYTNNSSGKVHIESLTFRNGKGEKGGGIQARIYRGELELVGNIVSGNSADSGGGLSVESSDNGQVFLANNIIYGNSAANAAVMRIVSAATGPITLLNNTIADNTATAAGDGRSLLVKSAVASVDLTNNIISGVSGVSGKDIYIDSSSAAIPLSITHNDFDAVNGLLVNAPGFVADASNIGDAPLFEAPLLGNYRLSSASPCIDKGIAHVDLPVKDAAGANRISGVGVDMGAYEFNNSLPKLTLSFAGNGMGFIDSTLPLFSCNVVNTQTLPYMTLLMLTPRAADFSRFGGWSGCDSVAGTVCSLTLDRDRTVEATFTWDMAYTARIHRETPPYYPTLQEAYGNALTGDQIEVWGIDLPDGLVCGGEKDVSIRGGYDQPYENRTRTTTLPGLTIGRGSVTVDGIVVR